MIRFETNQPAFYNDLCDVVRLFFGMEKVAAEGEADIVITHSFTPGGGKWTEACAISVSGGDALAREEAYEAVTGGRLYVERLMKRSAKLCLYALLKQHCGVTPPWGSLTGIRPTKLARQLIDEGCARDSVAGMLQSVFDVSAPKAALVEDILSAQGGIYRWGDETQFDVYVGIPFCRTRCLYCSFFSSSVNKPGLVQNYTDVLLREAAAFGRLMRERGRKCRSIYVGGGTPVSIPADELRRVLDATREAFPDALEFTVEAGRPDCITQETMRALRLAGADRVSVNPQTMVDRTLEIIGRGHDAASVRRAYALAREADIPHINMDIIAGLPGEGPQDMETTLHALDCFDMDNLTVHTLAVKHSSRLNERLADYPLPGGEAVSEMLDIAQAFARSRGMTPYYMYRQKYMAGNLENVGYALPGAECIYNVDMMEETHDIVALGAGAVSKRMYYEQTRHERYPNPKNIEYYICNVDDIIMRKEAFFQ